MPSKTLQRIHFIITGGTIDSHYDGTKDTIVPNKQSVIPSFILGLKLYLPTKFTTVCMKDSRDITIADRRRMLSTIERSSDTHFIITHGTYTMPDTARYLQAALTKKNKTIILTGSMIPMSGFTLSDGPFNLGFSIGKIAGLPTGVYVSMNGKIFEPNEVVKTLKEGRFSSILGEKR